MNHPLQGRSPGYRSDQTLWRWAILASVVALVALRLPFLQEPAVWIDEAFSLYHARNSLQDIWGPGWQLESSPPLYYSANWAWTRLFGNAEPAARGLPLLLTALAALFVHSAAASVGGPRAGAVAALLFLCQPLMFVYSLEIRPYALQVLLIAAAIAGFARALADRELGRIRSPTAALSRVVPIVAAAALATYTHSTTPAFLLALTGAAVVYGIVRRESGSFWLAGALCALTALLAITPQLLVMLEVIRTNERGIAWIPSPDLQWVLVVARSLAVGESTWNTYPTGLVGGMTVGLIAWSTWRVRARPLVLVVGLVLPALGFAFLGAVSLLQPVLMPRTSLWVVVPLCVLVGCGVSTIAGQGFRFSIMVASIVLPLSLMSAINMDSRTRDRPWPRFLAQLAREAHATDEVVAVDKEVLCVLDYYRAAGEPQRKRWRLERGPGQSYRSHQRIPLGCNEAEQLSVEQLSGRLSQGVGVWLLAGDDLQRTDIEAALEVLGPSVKVTQRYDWRNQTVVWRVARR